MFPEVIQLVSRGNGAWPQLRVCKLPSVYKEWRKTVFFLHITLLDLNLALSIQIWEIIMLLL